jgi:hypothetical protein
VVQAAPLAAPQPGLYAPPSTAERDAVGREAVIELRNLKTAVEAVREAIGLASGAEVAAIGELLEATDDTNRQRGRDGALYSDMRIGNKRR